MNSYNRIQGLFFKLYILLNRVFVWIFAQNLSICIVKKQKLSIKGLGHPNLDTENACD